MLKTASVALRQLSIKMSARWLSSCSDGFWVKEKMSEDDINHLRNQNIKRKIYAEYGAVDCYDHSFLKLERLASKDFEVLKSLHNDLKKYNRKNGIVPPQLKDPSLESHEFAFGGPIPESWRPRKDDTEVIESAQLAVKKYNKRHGSSLAFVSVLSVEIARHLGDCNMVIQARDPAAAGVSIKLNAHCCYRRVCQVLLRRPVSSINLLRKDERNKTGDGAIEALLYANPHNCPLIGRRLGLKTQDLDHRNYPKLVLKRRYLHHGDSRTCLLNLSLDDDSLMRIAQLAVNQRSTLHVLRVTGAWREKIADRRFLYHIVFEALEASLGRRFYSAVSVNAKGGAAKLVDLVALDSPKHTIK